MAARGGGRQTLTTGPWASTNDSADPWDDAPEILTDALNMIVPDVEGPSGIYARPGMANPNTAAQFGTKGQGQCCVTTSDGTIYRLLVSSGKLYRMASDFATAVDITPANVTIDSSATTRVAMLQFGDGLVVSDGLSKPWVAATFGSPVSGIVLLRGTTDTKLGMISFVYQFGVNASVTQAANLAGVTIPGGGPMVANSWAIWRVSISPSVVVTLTPGTANLTGASTLEAIALGNLPATPVGDFNLGYFTLQTGVGVPWTAGTDALAGGSTGAPAAHTTYYAGDIVTFTGRPIDARSGAVLLSRNPANDVQLAFASFSYQYGSAAVGTQAAGTVGTGSYTIAAGQWAVLNISRTSGGTVHIPTGPGVSINYPDEASAIAGRQPVPAGEWDMGYLTIKTAVGQPWIAGTDALAGGASGNPASVTNYYPSQGAPWSAWGRPTVYQGVLMFIANLLDGVSARTKLVWSEPADAFTGYEQTNYNDFWNLIQTNSDPLYAVVGTNVGVFVWRGTSITRLSGTPSINFSTTATADAIAAHVGTRAPESVAVFVDKIFFVDELGRPWMLPLYGQLVDIWRQMRGAIAAAPGVAFPAVTSYTATAAIEPQFHLYTVAIWSPVSATPTSPTVAYQFDALSGKYISRFTIGAGMSMNAIGLQRDVNGIGKLCVIGSKTAGGSGGGYVWVQQNVADAVWTDAGAVPQLSITTPRMGYHGSSEWMADILSAIVMSQAPCTVTALTPFTNNVLQATPTPNASADGTYRLVAGLDLQAARGIQVTISPTTAASQFGIQRVEIQAIPSLAGIED